MTGAALLALPLALGIPFLAWLVYLRTDRADWIDVAWAFSLGGLAIMDRTHTLWGSTNLGPSAVWRPLATAILGLDGTWEFTDTTSPTPAKLYYRISTP